MNGPEAARVELYADGVNGDGPVWQDMERVDQLWGPRPEATSIARGCPRNVRRFNYTERATPRYGGVAVPLESARILWKR
jgi:starch phosphorylase